MSVFAIILALGLEQLRPMRRHATILLLLRAWVEWIAESADAGTRWNALCVTAVAVVFPAAAVAGVQWLASHYMGWLAWAVVLPLHVLVLYVTLGFRQFSRPFNALKAALEAGDVEQAAEHMRQWRQQEKARDRQSLIEAAHRYALEDAHYCVFGVLLAYLVGVMLGLGAAGAVFYRLAAIAYARYRQLTVGAAEGVRLHQTSPALVQVSGALWNAVDYLPSRCTAAGFALLGNFEQAAAAWREAVRQQEAQEQLSPEQHVQVVQAAGAGALGVWLKPQSDSAATHSQSDGGGTRLQQGQRQQRAPAYAVSGAWGGTPDSLPEHGLYGLAGSAWYQEDDGRGDDERAAAASARDSGSSAPIRWVTAHLDSLVALLWRSLAFWLLVLLVLQLIVWLV